MADLDHYSYPYRDQLLDLDCRTEVPAAEAAGVPAVWLVVSHSKGPVINEVLAVCRTRAGAASRVAALEEDAHAFVPGFRVETGAAPAVYIALKTTQIGHYIDAVSEVKTTQIGHYIDAVSEVIATAKATALAARAEAMMHSVEDLDSFKVKNFDVVD